jgi:hypothetical protein
MVFHVPKRSSEEKMSPATTATSTGPSQPAPKPRTTIGIAKPESWTHWPKAVSPGVALCTRSTATARKGPMTASTAMIRTWIRRLIFSSSRRYTTRTPERCSPMAGPAYAGHRPAARVMVHPELQAGPPAPRSSR